MWAYLTPENETRGVIHEKVHTESKIKCSFFFNSSKIRGSLVLIPVILTMSVSRTGIKEPTFLISPKRAHLAWHVSIRQWCAQWRPEQRRHSCSVQCVVPQQTNEWNDRSRTLDQGKEWAFQSDSLWTKQRNSKGDRYVKEVTTQTVSHWKSIITVALMIHGSARFCSLPAVSFKWSSSPSPFPYYIPHSCSVLIHFDQSRKYFQFQT